MKFYLGTGDNWFDKTDVPLFVSRRTLAKRKTLPRCTSSWALDSGGFTRLLTHGSWDGLTPREYAAEGRRFRDEIGNLDFAAPMDWMCEEIMLQRTGKTVAEHQRLTLENYLELR